MVDDGNTPRENALHTRKNHTQESKKAAPVSNHSRRSLLRGQFGAHSKAAELTVRVDACQDIGDHHSTHDHHDGHNEVSHEGNEAEHQVTCGTPPTLDDLQERVSLQSSPAVDSVKWQHWMALEIV